jgi:hypothetical protein
MAAQIECPITLTAPETDNDPWLQYCEKDNMDLSKKILLSVAKNFNADVIEIDNIDSINSKFKNKMLVVHVKNCATNYDQLLSKLKYLDSSRSRAIFLFSKVPSGFSSKELFKEHGIEAVAVCACDFH